MTLPAVDAAALPGKPDVCRVVMYLDKQCNGATAAVSGGDGILTTGVYQAFNDLTNTGRFQILHDKMITMNVTAALSDGSGLASTPEVVREFSMYKKCDIPLEFNAAAGAITELRSNNIGVLLISANGVCKFDSRVRIRFSDA